MIQAKVTFHSGNTLLDSFNTKEEADKFFGKYYPDGKATYEIVGQEN